MSNTQIIFHFIYNFNRTLSLHRQHTFLKSHLFQLELLA